MSDRRQGAHGTWHHHHSHGGKTAAGKGRPYVTKTVNLIGQRMNLLARQPKLVLDVEYAWGRHHKMCLDIAHAAHRLQQASGINGTRGTGNAYHQAALGAHADA